MKKSELICRTEIEVKFSEVDSMGVVWHGNYIRYFEDGREAFGKKYHISYLDFHRMDVAIPLVKINCDYKKPLKYGDTAVIETRFVDSDAAKLRYDYTISNKASGDIVATGSSTQVFLNTDMELLLDFPAFFVEWKKEMGIMG
jgi:acyl-CoA thioester hydrolase